MPIVAPLVELGVIALVLWVIAVALAIALIMRKIGDVVGVLPLVGGYLRGAVDSMAQAVTNAAGTLESGVDKLIGASWHLLARYMDKMWHQFESSASIAAHIAQIVGKLIYDHSGLRSLVHGAIKTLHGIEHGIKTLEREWHGIERRVKTLERDITKGIGHDLRIEVKALDRELGRVEHKVIPAIRAEVTTAENDLTALGKWVKDHALLAGTSALVGAVAWALGEIGLGGLRCNSLLKSLGNRGCGLWQGLEDILGLLVDTAVLLNVCNLIGPLEAVVSEVAAPVVETLTAIGAGLCAGSVGSPSTLSTPNLHLPPNPGFTLELP